MLATAPVRPAVNAIGQCTISTLVSHIRHLHRLTLQLIQDYRCDYIVIGSKSSNRQGFTLCLDPKLISYLEEDSTSISQYTLNFESSVFYQNGRSAPLFKLHLLTHRVRFALESLGNHTAELYGKPARSSQELIRLRGIQ